MSQDNKQTFLNGFVFKRPRENAPSFVKGSMSIKVDEAIEFLTQHKKEDGWLNADLLVSKDGKKLYFTLNDWKPELKDTVKDSDNIETPF